MNEKKYEIEGENENEKAKRDRMTTKTQLKTTVRNKCGSVENDTQTDKEWK